MHRTTAAFLRQSTKKPHEFRGDYYLQLERDGVITHIAYRILKIVSSYRTYYGSNEALAVSAACSPQTIANEITALTRGGRRAGSVYPVLLRRERNARGGRVLKPVPTAGMWAEPHPPEGTPHYQNLVGGKAETLPESGSIKTEKMREKEKPGTPSPASPDGDLVVLHGDEDRVLFNPQSSDHDERPRTGDVRDVDRDTARTLAGFSRARRWSNAVSPREWADAAAILRRHQEAAGNPDGTPAELVAWYVAHFDRLRDEGRNPPRCGTMRQFADRWSWLVRLRDADTPKPRPVSTPVAPECAELAASLDWSAAAGEIARAAAEQDQVHAALQGQIREAASAVGGDTEHPRYRSAVEPLERIATDFLGMDALRAWYARARDWCAERGVDEVPAAFRWRRSNHRIGDRMADVLYRTGLDAAEIARVLSALGLAHSR